MEDVKKKRGRTPKFKSALDMQIAIDRYFRACDENLYMRGKVQDSTPYTVEGLCHALDITRETLRCYGDKDDTEFSDTIKRAKRHILADIMVRGLTGRSNPIIAIFNIKNNFGYVDKLEHDVNNKLELERIEGMRIENSPLNDLTIEQLDAIEKIIFPLPGKTSG